jgi:hypothetical protein
MIAPTHRIFKLEAGLDTSITLKIDTSKVTPESAADTVNLWYGYKDVLRAADGDMIQAYARWAAAPLIQLLVDGYTGEGAVLSLATEEGWPPAEEIGITIVDSDLPDLNAAFLEVTEVPA